MPTLRAKILISLLLPLLSVFVFAIIFTMENTNATGLAVLMPRPIETLDANLRLSIEEGEFIPYDSVVSLRYDGVLVERPLGHLLALQQHPPEIVTAENSLLNYAGKGIRGPYDVVFRLSDFIENAQTSNSLIIITLLYKTQVLAQTSSQLQHKS